MGLKPRIPDGPIRLVVTQKDGKFVADCPHKKCRTTRSHTNRATLYDLMAAHLMAAHHDPSNFR